MQRRDLFDPGSPGWPNPWEGFLPRRTLLMLRAYSTAPVAPLSSLNAPATLDSSVMGEGNPHARLMFIGEAQSEQARELLTKMIEAMGYKRSDVFVASITPCKPSGSPEQEAIATCSPLLLQQIESIQPEVIVALGKYAAQTLLQTEAPIARLRGSFKTFKTASREIPLMPTFHPGELLQNPQSKREAWEDLKQVRARLADSR